MIITVHLRMYALMDLLHFYCLVFFIILVVFGLGVFVPFNIYGHVETVSSPIYFFPGQACLSGYPVLREHTLFFTPLEILRKCSPLIFRLIITYFDLLRR